LFAASNVVALEAVGTETEVVAGSTGVREQQKNGSLVSYRSIPGPSEGAEGVCGTQPMR
jgi:hypothetical protein